MKFREIFCQSNYSIQFILSFYYYFYSFFHFFFHLIFFQKFKIYLIFSEVIKKFYSSLIEFYQMKMKIKIIKNSSKKVNSIMEDKRTEIKRKKEKENKLIIIKRRKGM